MKFLRKGCDVIAAGFLVFAIGESVILSGTAAGLVGSIPSFAAGITLGAAALVLISLPKEFATGVRMIGIATAILFAVSTFIHLATRLLLWSMVPLADAAQCRCSQRLLRVRLPEFVGIVMTFVGRTRLR